MEVAIARGKAASLGGRLEAARERAFTGRKEELAAFDSALLSGGQVLFVHGPGGVGKSALLRRFAQQAVAAGRPVTALDGRTLDPSPPSFEAVAGRALTDERAVLLIDTFEQLHGLEGWLRECLLPRLPAGAVVVVAGRIPPDLVWQADPGWAGTLRLIALRDLEPVDAAALLEARGVAGELRDPLLAFAGGHPLALSLGATVAIKGSAAGSRWRPTHDMVVTLLDQLIGEVPSRAHRHALQVCAHTYMTTQDVLRAVLPDDDAAALFSWLRRQPFIESSPLGLYPHDVVREILEADLRWRDPKGYADLHRRINTHLMARIHADDDMDVLGAVGSLFYLHRGEGRTPEPHFWHGQDEVYEDVFRPEDTEDLLRLAATYDAGSAAAVSHWTVRQPQAFRLYRRTGDGELAAATAWLRLDTQVEAQADPVVATAWANAHAVAPLRPGEHLAVGRSWVHERYRGTSPVTDLIQWRTVGWCLRSERMAWSFMAVHGEDPSRDHYNMHDLGDHAWEGDAEYVLRAHDWRAVPAHLWLERLLPVGRQRARITHEPELAVLSQAEFTEALRKALRHLSKQAQLAANPLTRGRLLAGQADPARALRALLEQAINDLSQDPRAGKLHRALDLTYLRGAPTQEAAAERLGLPFTTYRRHLLAGIERICEDLWRRELHGSS
ncbi:AAA family ATPase [Nonomuraea insulae]|uniref:AAA family ATPase n=1 Tax=Nonomuraea insulae TaxID=1616787 RepID=A0ABW1DDY1_9ACTN